MSDALKKYLILPIQDDDVTIIWDAVQMYAESVGTPEIESQARRITAEIGYWEDDAPRDILHVTAYVTDEDPRPKEDQ